MTVTHAKTSRAKGPAAAFSCGPARNCLSSFELDAEEQVCLPVIYNHTTENDSLCGDEIDEYLGVALNSCVPCTNTADNFTCTCDDASADGGNTRTNV